MEQHDRQQQSFGSLLRRHRTQAGLTQEQLAERAGLSRRGVADLERGVRLVPYPNTIERLATGLSLSPSEHASLVEAARHQRSAAAGSRPGPRHNLPQRPNRFVGRQHERQRLADLLSSSALLTLIGPGGVGKTRLALEVAADQAERWPDGVWLVELSAFADAVLVPRAVAASLGVSQQPDRDTLDDLVDWLRDKRLLLVLDNCEHLLDGCGALVGRLLRACPGLGVLATSREILGIEAEKIWRVDPLAVPEGDVASAEAARESEAVRLFAERASAAAPEFELTDRNAVVVADICRRLDGLPLALELTAARLRLLSLDDIAHRLDQRFDLLTGGHRDALPRHRTLRALVDWSYDLLDQPERELFEHLSVFSGGWTLDAAEAVSTLDRTQTLDVLGRLVDKSLVRTEPQSDASVRYAMLETLREYATERLRVSDCKGAIERRHAFFYADALTHWFGPVWWGEDTPARLARIARDYANMQTSSRWLIDHAEVEAAQHQAGSLAFFWLLHGWIQDGFAWLTQAVSLSDSSEMKTAAWFEALVGLSYMVGGDRQVTLARLEAELPRGREAADAPTLALALMQVGRLTWMVRHDLEVARAHLEEAVCVAGRAGSEPLQAFIRGHFAGFLYEAGEYELAERLLEQNLRAGGAFESYLSQNKLLLGWVRLARGDPPGAARLLEEVLAEPFASRSPYWSVMALTALSWVGLAQQDVEAAILSATRALAIVREHLGRDMTPGFLGAPLEAFAEIASATGQPVRALQLAAAASAFREKHHIRRSPSERELLSRWMARSRVALGPSASEQHTAAGRALTPEQAIAEALEVETVHRAQAVTP